MKKVISISLVLVIGSFVAWIMTRALDLKATSEIIGDHYAGAAFILIYVFWGGISCTLTNDILKESKFS